MLVEPKIILAISEIALCAYSLSSGNVLSKAIFLAKFNAVDSSIVNIVWPLISPVKSIITTRSSHVVEFSISLGVSIWGFTPTSSSNILVLELINELIYFTST